MKMIRIFQRDVKVNFRNFLSFWIMFLPIVFCFIIRVVTPGIADSPVRVAMLRNSDPGMQQFLQHYASVELYDNVDQLEERVMQRDDVPAIVPDGAGGSYILTQGNEQEGIVSAVKLLKSYQEAGVTPSDDAVKIHDFGRTAPPLKTVLITSMLVLITVLSGMLIAINIVEEKEDKTIRAIRVAPVSTSSFVFGKSMFGVFNTAICTVLSVLVAGYAGINFAQLLLVALSASLISFIIGFLTGLTSDDFVSAAGSIKILMLPALAPILAMELLDEKWWKFFYWSPFYWAYDGIKSILQQNATWSRIVFDTVMVAVIAVLLYLVLTPKIKKKML